MMNEISSPRTPIEILRDDLISDTPVSTYNQMIRFMIENRYALERHFLKQKDFTPIELWEDALEIDVMISTLSQMIEDGISTLMIGGYLKYL